MHTERHIEPVRSFGGTIRPPGSKSLTNRALVCAALARGESTLRGALVSEDTAVMIDSLGRLGVAIADEPGGRLRVLGCGGRWPAAAATLDVANSGTTMRFLAAAVALGHGQFVLDGTARMRERPIGDLLAALAGLGVDARAGANQCPPVTINAHGLGGGTTTVAGGISSQFLSGLLLAVPCAEGDVEVRVAGELVSQPYVRMTLAVMRAFGGEVEDEGFARFHVRSRGYHGRDFDIEPDASAASYFFAAAAITGGTVFVEGLSRSSLQGDVDFCECLRAMGCQVDYAAGGIRVTGGRLAGGKVFDMNAISDTVQTIAAVALFADGPTTIRGVGHIRHKETDRIGDLARELRKLGAEVEEAADGLTIRPGVLRPARIETYRDHRMAMSLALVGLRQPGIVILDPGCTAKTYPRFFDDFESLAVR